MAFARWLSIGAASFMSGGALVLGNTQDLAQPDVNRVEAKQVEASSDGLLKSIVSDLASDDVMVRIDAQRRLTDAGSIRLRDIEQVVRGAVLTPEQRQRVTSAAYVRFCLEPRAAMGIMSSFEVADRGLLLQAVVPGFPSAEVLRAGDRIISIDGHPVNDITVMKPLIIARDPGDEVQLVVNRAGTTLNLKVKLGRATDFNSRDRFAITPDLLDEAWVFRSQSLADPSAKLVPPPIESGLPEAAWQPVGTPEVTIGYNDGGDPNLDPGFKVDARRLQNPDQRDLGLVAAGEPRGAGSQIRWAALGPPTIRIGPNARVVPDGDAAAELERIRGLQVTRLRAEQDQLRQRIEALRNELANANEARKAQIVELIARSQRRIQSIDAQMQARVLNP